MKCPKAGVDGAAIQIASQVARADPGWVDVLQIRWLAGGPPERTDGDAAVINRRFAERVRGRLDVVDERILAPAAYSAAGGAVDGLSSFRVAGVVDDMSFTDPVASEGPAVFLNSTQPSDASAFILLRGPANARDIELALNDVLAGQSPAMEVARIVSMEEALARLSAPDRAQTAMSGLRAKS